MSEIKLISLPYQADSAGLIQQLGELPLPVIFDSSTTASASGRYDILTALPCAYVKVVDGFYHCSDKDLLTESGDDFFTLLQSLLDRHQVNSTTARPGSKEIPFCGGLAGYLGYPALNYPTPSYPGPGNLVLGGGDYQVNNAFFGIYNWALIQDHQEQECYLLLQPDFPEHQLTLIQKRLQHDPTEDRKFQLSEKFGSDMKPSYYSQAFDRIKSYIVAGDCYQVNMAQRFSARYEGHPLAAYQTLRAAAGGPFSAYIHWGDGALLSVSPERFISHRQGQVLTQPIKGTRPRSSDLEVDKRLAEELINSEKDIAENLMIVDLLRNDLGRVCRIGSVEVSKLFELQSFTNVHHLVSTISGTLDTKNTPLDIIKHCYPGGSITGAPKLRAMEIIDELESHPRDIYCGCVMYLDYAGNMDSNITIRTLLSRENTLYCWAGGGIVDDSTCEAEYQECFDKIASIKNALESRDSLLDDN